MEEYKLSILHHTEAVGEIQIEKRGGFRFVGAKAMRNMTVPLSPLLCILLLLLLHAYITEGKYRKEKKQRAYTTRSRVNDLLVRHWNTTNDRLNSLDGNLLNHANESAAISLSKAPDGYVVFIKLQRTCNIYHPPKEWFTQETVNLMKENGIGPDEIVVQLEGPSLQTKIALSQNFCNEYYAVFQVPLSGNYNLKVFRIRRHYEGSREQDKFPKMTYEEFLNVFVQIESHYPTPCEDPSTVSISIYLFYEHPSTISDRAVLYFFFF